MGRFANPVRERVEDGNAGVIMGFLPQGTRNHMVAWLAEFAGTFLFLFFSFSIATVANTPPAPADSNPLPDVSKLLYIALGFGCSVAINVWIFYRISGGQLNPAVFDLKWQSCTLVLTYILGDLDTVARRGCPRRPLRDYCDCPSDWRHRCSRGLVRAPTWPIPCQCAPWWWHLHRSWPFHRDVHDDDVGHDRDYACCSEVKVYVAGSYWDWYCPFHWTSAE